MIGVWIRLFSILNVFFLVIFVVAATGFAQARVRVFVTDSQSLEGKKNSGARSQNAEIARTIGKKCPELTVTIDKEKADYILILDHEDGKSRLARDNKWVVYNKDGDIIGSGSVRSIGNAVKDTCAAISKEIKANSR